MDQLHMRLGTGGLALVMVACGAGRSVTDAHPYRILAAPTVNDALPLSSRSGDMENLAFTFPVFDLGAAETRINIRAGDFKVRADHEFWQLLGDGGQTTVTLERLTKPGLTPLVVRLSLGPVFDGMGIRSPLHTYTFERIEGGWQRRNYKIVEQGVAPNLSLASLLKSTSSVRGSEDF